MKNFSFKKTIFLSFIFLSIFFLSFSKVNAGSITKPANNLGLVSYLSFNDATSTTATDFSGNRNDGTLVGMAHPATASSGWGSGKFGSGLNFDGTSDYVTVDGVADNVTQTSFAVSSWVKCTIGLDHTIWGTNISTSNQDKTGVYIHTTGMAYVWDGFDVAEEITGSINVCDNSWHHTVYTRTGSTGTFYIDGVSQGTHTAGYTFASNDLWTIGMEWETGPTMTFFLTGAIDEFRVYSRPLSLADVTALYSSGGSRINGSQKNLITNGLVGYWPFDGSDVTDKVYDRSGSNQNGYFNGRATSTAKTIGKVGQAFDFDGTSDNVYLGNPSSFNDLGPFTYSFWINPRTVGGGGRGHILSKTDPGGGSLGGFLISMSNLVTEAVNFLKLTDGTTINRTTTANSVPLNVWTHLVVTWDGSVNSNNLRIYINGVEASYSDTSAASGSLLSDVNNPLRIGIRGALDRAFDGKIDEARIYNRVLTASEIKTLYNAGATKVNSNQNVPIGSGLNSGLVGMWSFNGLDLTDKVYDRSGQGNDGYVYNGATSTMKTIGKVGQALLFNGTTNYLNIGSPASLDDLPAISYSFWIKPRSAGNGRGSIVSKTNTFDAAGLAYVFFDNVTATNGISFLRDTTSADIGYTSANNVAPLNQWTHGVVTWDGTIGNANNVRIYINGTETTYQITDTGTGGLESDASNTFTIGSRSLIGSERYFDGQIDEVRVYNRVLTASEVKQLYNLSK